MSVAIEERRGEKMESVVLEQLRWLRERRSSRSPSPLWAARGFDVVVHV